MRIASDFFINNRIEFMNRLSDDIAVFIYAGSNRPMSQDNDYRFHVDRNYYYLTGMTLAEGRLVLYKTDGALNIMLFVEGKDPMVERWHGKRPDFETVSEISGIPSDCIFNLDEFDEKTYSIVNGEYTLGFDGTSITKQAKKFEKTYKNTSDIGEALTKMRMVKKPGEIEAITEAAKITEAAIEEMKEHIRPGVTEIELYTALEYAMSKRGCLIPAFATITALNDNAFYLHHSEPENEDGEIGKIGGQLQIDVGARVNGYCADISRVFFFGGKTSEEDYRFKLHELIVELRKLCWEEIKPGINFTDLNRIIRLKCGEYLQKWGLLDEGFTEEDVRKYYWHNTGHHLGLDVHDISIRELPFVSGNVLAIEPGVYIPEWHAGFRIEDDVLVTDDGCRLLSSGLDTIDSIVVE